MILGLLGGLWPLGDVRDVSAVRLALRLQDGSGVKALAAKPDKVSLTPRMHTVERESQLLQAVRWCSLVWGNTHCPYPKKF